jgi:ribosome biogenesis GTPase
MFSQSLRDMGWCEFFARAYEALPGAGQLVPGRVVLQQRGRYNVVTAEGEVSVELEARFRKEAVAAANLPSVGDWVAIRRSVGEGAGSGLVCALLPRLTKFSRRAAGVENVEQVLAANVDTVFIAMGLDGDFNLRRLERYLTVTWASGARPVVLLTKADLCSADGLRVRIAEVQAIAPRVTVLATSVFGAGGAGPVAGADLVGALDSLGPFLGRGQTVVLLGSSGVGKSTIVNRLLQRDVLRTGLVRSSDGRGRHTTTQRQLFHVRGGALVIDTPGIRELQLWDATGGLALAFADVETVAAGCRFRDCRHQEEPDCAVVGALARGQLRPERLAAFRKLKNEEQTVSGPTGERLSGRQRRRAGVSPGSSSRRKQ